MRRQYVYIETGKSVFDICLHSQQHEVRPYLKVQSFEFKRSKAKTKRPFSPYNT